ncbi:MAG: hypothetical protein QNJ01_08260 [Desulfobacterales bacterium]|nr:hypothetical protein [Desulfobacterales bacterium]
MNRIDPNGSGYSEKRTGSKQAEGDTHPLGAHLRLDYLHRMRLLSPFPHGAPRSMRLKMRIKQVDAGSRQICHKICRLATKVSDYDDPIILSRGAASSNRLIWMHNLGFHLMACRLLCQLRGETAAYPRVTGWTFPIPA